MDTPIFATIICLVLRQVLGLDTYGPGDYYGPQDGTMDSAYPASNLQSNSGPNDLYDTHGYMSDWQSGWLAYTSGHILSRPRCLPIPANVTLCQNLDYTEMRLPNLLEHDSIDEVIEQSTPWQHLVSISCHPDTQIFLCSLYAPVCLQKTVYHSIQPCRNLCEAVKNGCEPRMIQQGFTWPEILDCARFPLPNGMCIPPQEAHTNTRPNLCQACNQPNSIEAVLDNFCNGGSVFQASVRKIGTKRDGLLHVTVGAKKRFFKKEDAVRDMIEKEVKSLGVRVENTQKCDCTLKTKAKYLMTGRMKGRQFVANAFHLYDGSTDMKKAMRVMRKNPEFCQKRGAELLGPRSLFADSRHAPLRKRREKGKGKRRNN